MEDDRVIAVDDDQPGEEKAEQNRREQPERKLAARCRRAGYAMRARE
jgi:hypothetical protein